MARGKTLASLVVHVDEIDAVIRLKGREPQTLAVKPIRRYGEGDSSADGRLRRVSHHIALEPFHARDARILTAASAVRPKLVVRLRLDRDAEPLDACRIAGVLKPNPANAAARIIAARDESSIALVDGASAAGVGWPSDRQ